MTWLLCSIECSLRLDGKVQALWEWVVGIEGDEEVGRG